MAPDPKGHPDPLRGLPPNASGLAHALRQVGQTNVHDLRNTIQTVDPLSSVGPAVQRHSSMRTPGLYSVNPPPAPLEASTSGRALPEAQASTSGRAPSPEPEVSVRPLFRPAAMFPALSKDPKQTKLASRLKHAKQADPEHFALVQAQIYEQCQRILDRSNPFTRKHREEILASWNNIVGEAHPGRSDKELWTTEIVEKWARPYLRTRVQFTPGQGGAAHVRAVTLRNWTTTLVNCILKYTHDPKTSESTGLYVLVHQGLFQALEDEVSQLVEDYKLNRYQKKKLYYGRAETQLLIEAAMDEASGRSRIVGMQHVCCMLSGFFFAVRPGSIGVSCQEYANREFFAKTGDVEIIKIGPFKFEVRITIGNFKGHNDVTAKQHTFIITGVFKSHNALFDATLWWVLYLMERGVLPVKTIDELIAYKGATIPIVLKDEPLLLKVLPGGKGLMAGIPMTAGGISHGIRGLSEAAGLPGGSMGCFRRDTGNDFGIKLGKDVGAMILAHREQNTTFNGFYDRNTANFPLVGTRLNEFDSFNAPETKASLKLHEYTSAAVAALVNRKHFRAILVSQQGTPNEAAGVAPPEPLAVLTEAEITEAENIPEFIAVCAEMSHAWEDLANCFAVKHKESIKPYKPCLENISKLERHKNIPELIAVRAEMSHAWEDLANCFAVERKESIEPYKPCRENISKLERHKVINPNVDVVKARYIALCKQNEKMQRAIRRKATTAKRRQHNAAKFQEGRAADTMEARFASLDALKTQQSAVLQAACNFTAGAVAPTESSSHMQIPPPPINAASAGEWAAWLKNINDSFPVIAEPEGECADEWEAEEDGALQLTQLSDILRRDDAARGVQQKPKPKSKKVHPTASAKGKAAASAEDAGDDTDLPFLTDSEMIVMDDEPEAEVLQIGCDDMRIALARYILAPIAREREWQNWYDHCGQQWMCPLCARAAERHPSLVVTTVITRGHLERHLALHTPWYELELEMLTTDEHTFKCPSANCSFSASTIHLVRKHCVLGSCTDKVRYRQLALEHNIASRAAQHRHQGAPTETEAEIEEKYRRAARLARPYKHAVSDDSHLQWSYNDQVLLFYQLVARMDAASLAQLMLSTSLETVDPQTAARLESDLSAWIASVVDLAHSPLLSDVPVPNPTNERP
ncbi:uncharacterized protein FIBRA_09387 [Fibroporia radiculosa]|uniref:Uncharacterized protein n=1 Tax=Fibroporia radiculosa TaxID=599839 RepID=J7S6E4_9APHY|nr:uncharacterized protein FIBRA_09387 [Fibroporia radiculosa]CCM07064.1 predicted protein [Fibroporia radiculosa]